MRKLLFGLLALIILVILLVPYGMGFVVRSQFIHNVRQLHGIKGLKVKMLNYKRGWFTSQALIQIQRKTPAVLKVFQVGGSALPKELDYQINLHIYNGPVAWAKNMKNERQLYWGEGVAKGRLVLKTPTAETLGNLKSLSDPLKLFAVMGLNGESNVTLQRQAIQLNNPQKNVMISVGFLKGQMQVSQRGKHVVGHIDVQGLDINSRSFQATLTPFDVKFDYNQVKDAIWQGSTSTHFPSLVLNYDNKKIADAKNAVFTLTKHITKEKVLDGTEGLTIDSIKTPQGEFKQIQFLLDVDHIDLNKVLGLVKQVQSKAFQSLPKHAQDAVFEKAMPGMFEGVSIDMKKLQAETPLGFVSFNGQYNIPKTIASDAKGEDDFQKLIYSGQGNLHADLPDLTKRLTIPMGPGPVMPAGYKPAQLSGNEKAKTIAAVFAKSAVDQGYLIVKKDRLISDIHYADGKITINGKPFELPKPAPKQQESQGQAEQSQQSAAPAQAAVDHGAQAYVNEDMPHKLPKPASTTKPAASDLHSIYAIPEGRSATHEH